MSNLQRFVAGEDARSWDRSTTRSRRWRSSKRATPRARTAARRSHDRQPTSISGGTIAADYGWIDDSMAPHPARLPARGREARDGCGGHRRLHRRAGAADARGDAVAARSRGATLPSSAASSDGSICRQDVDAQLAGFADDRALVGVRHIVQAEADGFLRAAGVSRGHRPPRAARAWRTTSSCSRGNCRRRSRSRARFPRQRFVLDHLGKPDVRGGAFGEWRRHLRDRSPRCPTLLQAVGTGDGSRLARLDARAAASVSRRRARRVRAGSDHDRQRLAGVSGRRARMPT